MAYLETYPPGDACHNAAAPAHDRSLLGTREHSVMANVTGGTASFAH